MVKFGKHHTEVDLVLLGIRKKTEITCVLWLGVAKSSKAYVDQVLRVVAGRLSTLHIHNNCF